MGETLEAANQWMQFDSPTNRPSAELQSIARGPPSLVMDRPRSRVLALRPLLGARRDLHRSCAQSSLHSRHLGRQALTMKLFLLTSVAAVITSLVVGEQRQGLIEESLLFPRNTISDYVVIQPQKEMSLNDLTLCLRYNTEQRTRQTLFSYTSTVPQDLVLSREDERTLKVIIGGREIQFQLPVNLWGWVHICITREKEKQLVGLYVNGEPSTRKMQEDTQPVTSGGTVILGQQKGSMARETSFVGEILDVNLWNRVLHPKTIQKLSKGDSTPQGNVIGWLTARVETKGKVVPLKSTLTQ
ncbi:jeltraxin-like [Pristis pectinata]|uniref:jeltraxin-like n=1 Tax=Pristis pectinata TaxID=685728 RepID=UPI00223D6F60|nr:jeltraxin-like [Pristis pectinata]